MNRNNLDMAMLITDAILNQFERNGKVNIPLDEHKYSFPLQDRIQIELEKIANEDMINDNTKSIGEEGTIDYLNERVKVKGQEIYGKVIREYSSEVLVDEVVIKDEDEETTDGKLYFKKSEVEIVNE